MGIVWGNTEGNREGCPYVWFPDVNIVSGEGLGAEVGAGLAPALFELSPNVFTSPVAFAGSEKIFGIVPWAKSGATPRATARVAPTFGFRMLTSCRVWVWVRT